MTRPLAPPTPLFVHFGIGGGATCCCCSQNRFFVGSMHGRIVRIGIDSNLIEEIVFEDEERRKVQSLNFCESQNNLVVLIRGAMILILSESEKWKIMRKIEISHIGFCNSAISNETIFFVNSEEKSNSTVLSWAGFLDPVVGKLDLKLCSEEYQVVPMSLAISSENEEILIGMEDGTLQICKKIEKNNQYFLSETLKLGKDPIFCVATCSKYTGVGCSKSPIILMENTDRINFQKPMEYPQTASGCSSVTFTPNSKQLLAGFWDGSIRVFSCLRCTILLAISSPHTSTISSLNWRKEDDLVIATSHDGVVSIWKLK